MAENRQGKKEEERRQKEKPQDKNLISAAAMKGGHNERDSLNHCNQYISCNLNTYTGTHRQKKLNARTKYINISMSHKQQCNSLALINMETNTCETYHQALHIIYCKMSARFVQRAN